MELTARVYEGCWFVGTTAFVRIGCPKVTGLIRKKARSSDNMAVVQKYVRSIWEILLVASCFVSHAIFGAAD